MNDIRAIAEAPILSAGSVRTNPCCGLNCVPKGSGFLCAISTAEVLFKSSHPVNKRIEDVLVLWAFDLMHSMAMTWRPVHREDRKRRLNHLIDRSGIARLLHSETFGDGERLLAIRQTWA